MKNKVLFLTTVVLSLLSCKGKTEPATEVDPSVPVTLTTIDTSAIKTFTELNATATYMAKNVIKANATGYLNSVNAAQGDFVKNGKILFTIKTREAKVLGNTINKLDPSLNFGRAIPVASNTDGYITSINVQQGDYVQDGDPLANINDADSFALVLSLPYGLKNLVTIGKVLTVLLPDGSMMKAQVQKFLPVVDPASQSQSVSLKVIGKQIIPENLIVTVRIDVTSKAKRVSLPKAAVLSDETETNFWIMKMINRDTAVKIAIEKGAETTDRIEVLSPALTLKDKILVSGNYGVADTIKVKVLKK